MGFLADGVTLLQVRKIKTAAQTQEATGLKKVRRREKHNTMTTRPFLFPSPPRLVRVMHKTLTLEQEKRVTVLTGFPFL